MSFMRIGGTSLIAICSVPLPEHCRNCGRLDLPPLLFSASVIHGHLSALQARRKSLFNLEFIFSSSAGVFHVRAVAQGVGFAEAEPARKKKRHCKDNSALR